MIYAEIPNNTDGIYRDLGIEFYDYSSEIHKRSFLPKSAFIAVIGSFLNVWKE